MAHWWVTDVLGAPHGWVILLGWTFWVVFSIVLHELAHGWAAIACGDDTPRWSGHMTWNPVVHMGWPSLILFAVMGIAWGAMPVNPSRFRGRHDDALVAFAGPMMNILLSVGSIAAYCLWVPLASGYWFGTGVAYDTLVGVGLFLFTGAWLNLALALFNLLPVPPLDGSRIVASFFPPYRQLLSTEAGRIATFIVVLLMFSQAGGFIYAGAQRATRNASDRVLQAIAPGSKVSPTSRP